MFRKNHILFALVMSFSASAFALVGGPFDNGDYNELLDADGIYQWTAYLSNGLGQGQFASGVSLGPSIANGGGGSNSTQTTNSSVGTVSDRSIYYYKGVTFFGGCFGMVDMSQKTISCVTNGQSEVTLSQQGASTSTGGILLIGTASNVNATTNVVNNGSLGFVANSEWNGTIGPVQPTLKFKGEGQLTVLSPDVQPLLSNLAQQIVQAATGTAVNVAASLAGARQFAGLPQCGDSTKPYPGQRRCGISAHYCDRCPQILPDPHGWLIGFDPHLPFRGNRVILARFSCFISMLHKSNTRGYSLIELLMVVIIVALLATISLPLYGLMRDKADARGLPEQHAHRWPRPEQLHAGPQHGLAAVAQGDGRQRQTALQMVARHPLSLRCGAEALDLPQRSFHHQHRH